MTTKTQESTVLKTIQKPKDERAIRRAVEHDATEKEIQSMTSSCINHLCGCR